MSALTFLDTGYLLALELTKDQNHRAAARHWQGFLRQQPRLVTTTFVFDDALVCALSTRRDDPELRIISIEHFAPQL